MSIDLSIVIPVYNETSNLEELHSRLSAVIQSMDISVEILFIDDGSTDDSPEILSELASNHSIIKVLTLARNFGHQSALSAGLAFANGQAMVLMDADLQDRPESIPDFYAKKQEGYQVVYAVRTKRKESLLRRVAFKAFYQLISRTSRIRQPLDAGIFCMIDKEIADIIKAMPERGRYFPGLRAYAGHRQVGVEVERGERFADAPKVGTMGQIRLALDAIFSFSIAPIRFFTAVGLIIACCSFLFLINVIIHKILAPDDVILGVASILVAVLFIGGLQLVMLGILGEYIGRIYEESKCRPYFIVSKKQNFDSEEADSA